MRWHFKATENPYDCLYRLRLLTISKVPMENIKLGNSGVYYYWDKELF